MLEGDKPLASDTARSLAGAEMLEAKLSTDDQLFLKGPEPVLIYDAETLGILYANAAAADLYGYTRESLQSLSFSDLLARPADRDELMEELRLSINVLRPVLHRRADLQELVVGVVIFRLDVPGLDTRLAVLQDTTAKVEAQDALRASEERYRELFENANDVIFLHDLHGTVQAVNRATELLTGYSRSELLHQDFSKVVSPEAHGSMSDSIRAHLGGTPTQHYELPIVSKAGIRRFLEVSTRVLYRRGQPVAIQGIGRDITERKQSQERLILSAMELKAKNEELSTALRLAREATQLKEQFLANTSHELRTPMNGIMGMVTLLQGTSLDPEQREFVDAVSQCASDLLTIINDLLDVSQIEAGRLSMTEELFDLRESVGAVMKMLRLKAAAKGLTLTSDLDRSLPALIAGDSVRFRQVIMNLTANAIKFTLSGGVRIRAGLTADRQCIFCEVVDSGIGVEPAVQDKIFEAFFQADGTLRRRFGGTGLGLTISKQLVEIMGGRIGMRNNDPAPGATFWFELPLRTTESTPSLVAQA